MNNSYVYRNAIINPLKFIRPDFLLLASVPFSRSRIRRMSYGYAPPPPPLPAKQASWFSRNWKWFVPTVIIVPVLLVALLVGAILSFVFGAIKTSEPCQHAVATASHDARVTAQLGEPVETGWLVNGNINVSGPAGEADLAIPLNGRLRHGTVYVVARKSAGIWRYQRLEVAIEGKPERINLLSSSPEVEDR
jgi:hypothetical protein